MIQTPTQRDQTHGETVLAEKTRDASIQDTKGGKLPTINTDGQFTYKLDRYSKNSLLIFHNNCTYASDNTVAKVKKTFERLRFEVEIDINAPRGKVHAILDEFFKRDFTEYGCVAVVVVSQKKKQSSPTQSKQKHYHFNAEDFAQYFDFGDQSTLHGKPKIFISEAYVGREWPVYRHRKPDIYDLRYNQFKMFDEINISDSDSDSDSDSENIAYNPLSMLCDNLNKFGEDTDFSNIVKLTNESFATASKKFPKQNNPGDDKIPVNAFSVVSTLDKELWL